MKLKACLVSMVFSAMIVGKMVFLNHPVQEGLGEIMMVFIMLSLVLWFLGEAEEPIMD